MNLVFDLYFSSPYETDGIRTNFRIDGPFFLPLFVVCGYAFWKTLDNVVVISANELLM